MSPIIVGTAGEHIVCADLICAGYPAFITSAGLVYDVAVEIDARLLRVAVKSTLTPKPRGERNKSRPCYQFNIIRGGSRGQPRSRYTERDVDLVALVALDTKQVAYIPISICPCKLHLDPPGPVSYAHAKGPKPGAARRFADFTLGKAIGWGKQPSMVTAA